MDNFIKKGENGTKYKNKRHDFEIYRQGDAICFDQLNIKYSSHTGLIKNMPADGGSCLSLKIIYYQ